MFVIQVTFSFRWRLIIIIIVFNTGARRWKYATQYLGQSFGFLPTKLIGTAVEK